MATWSSARIAILRNFWGSGLSTSQIAKAMGGFDHCADGGRSAVIGVTNRLRQAAKKRGDEADLKFWTRAKLGNARVRHPPRLTGQKFRAPRVSSKNGPKKRERPIPRSKVQAFIDSIAPAPLKTDRNPLWQGAAFPQPKRGDPDALTESELTALVRAYE